MLFFGHKFIPGATFYHVTDIDSIVNTPSSSTLLIEFNETNLDVIKHAKENLILFALEVKTITQIVYGNALGASYIIVNPSLAKSAQSIANNYLFDPKILVKIEDENEIEEMVMLGVDGVLFKEAIVKITQ